MKALTRGTCKGAGALIQGRNGALLSTGGTGGSSEMPSAAEYENESMTGVRIDKWLWAARFFKTRALAARACELGRVESRGQPVKPARDVRVGDLLQVKNDSGDFQIEVLLLSDMRGPATVARTLYRETDESRELRQKLAEQRKTMPYFEVVLHEGRPSKRERRELDRFRGRT